MSRNQLQCYLLTSQPLHAEKYAAKLYDLLDQWRYRPAKFDDAEPIRNLWADRSKFVEICHANGKRYFAISLIRWLKPSFYLHVVSQYGPRETNHSLSIYAAKIKHFGGDGAPHLLELADDLFEQLDFDYGFACLESEFDSLNCSVKVHADDNSKSTEHSVGMEWPDCIPGLYWCNYFGSVYFEQGFGKRIDEAAYVHRLSNGVRLLRSPSVLDWDTPQAQAESQRLMDLLGRDWFFTKSSGMPPKCLQTDKSLFAKPPS